MTNTNEDRYLIKNGKTVNKTYIAKKRGKEKKQKLFSKPFIVLLVILGFLSIVYSIYRHSYLKISQIYISGNYITNDSEIIGKVGNPIGENILLYKADDHIEDLTKLDYVESASIKKVFPNLINVSIKESYPLFYQKGRDKTSYISNDGKFIGNDLDLENKEKLIEINGTNLKENLNESFTSSKASLDFLQALQKYQYFSQVNQLNLENKSEIGIMINDIDVKFGDLNDIDYKLNLLDKILNDINEKSLTAIEIDIKDKENPKVIVDKESFSKNLNY